MRKALGTTGAKFMAAGIAVSTVGFLSQGMLTAPRVYYAMARDGLFFKRVGSLNEKSRAPVTAIALQGVWASVIVLFFGVYGPVLNYVVSLDAVFFGLTGAALLVFRKRDPVAVKEWRCLASVDDRNLRARVLDAGVEHDCPVPKDAGMGVLLLLLGVPVYLYWRRLAVPR